MSPWSIMARTSMGWTPSTSAAASIPDVHRGGTLATRIPEEVSTAGCRRRPGDLLGPVLDHVAGADAPHEREMASEVTGDGRRPGSDEAPGDAAHEAIPASGRPRQRIGQQGDGVDPGVRRGDAARRSITGVDRAELCEAGERRRQRAQDAHADESLCGGPAAGSAEQVEHRGRGPAPDRDVGHHRVQRVPEERIPHEPTCSRARDLFTECVHTVHHGIQPILGLERPEQTVEHLCRST